MWTAIGLIAVVVTTNRLCKWLDEFLDAMDEVEGRK